MRYVKTYRLGGLRAIDPRFFCLFPPAVVRFSSSCPEASPVQCAQMWFRRCRVSSTNSVRRYDELDVAAKSGSRRERNSATGSKECLFEARPGVG